MGKDRAERAPRARRHAGEAVQQVAVQVRGQEARPAPATELPRGESGPAGLAVAGSGLAGEFRCVECGYGAVVQRALPPCPMCGGMVWESVATLPSRVAD
jgi:rubrerythrin